VSITAQLAEPGSISAQLASTAAHDTASVTAHRTASAHARARDDHGRFARVPAKFRAAGGHTVAVVHTADRGQFFRVTTPDGYNVPLDPWNPHGKAEIRTVGQLSAVLARQGEDMATLKEVAPPVSASLASLAGRAAGTTSGQLDLSAASQAKAHATASATARAHAKADEARNKHGEWTRFGAADLVVHQDGTVAHKTTRTMVGSLSHEDGKWVAHHADGTVSRHATRSAALREIAARHNKAGAAPDAAGKPSPVPVPAKAAAVKTISRQAAAPPPAAQSADEAYRSVQQTRGHLSNAEEMALGTYGTTFGYTVVNPFLHHNGQVFDTSKKKYVPATPHEKARAQELIKDIDSTFTKSAPLKQPVTTYRGTGNMDDLFGPVGSMAGKTFTSKAYTSTTTVPEAAGGNGLDYETKQGKLEISVPAGSKVVTGNDFEHEVILPRNARFSVLSDEMDGSTRHVKLQYQPGNEKPAPAPPPPVKTISAQAAAPGADTKTTAPAMSADEAAAAAAGANAEKQAESISSLGQMGGKSTQLAVIKKTSTGDLQAADHGFQQRAAAHGNPGKVTAAHQMVRDEIARRGGTLADLTQGVRVKSAGEIAAGQRKDLMNAWSTSYRYKGTTEAKSPRIADFAKEMHRLLSTNKPPAKCGLGCQDAHKFLGMVDSEAKPQPKELQRGLTLSSAAAERMFKPGKTADMPTSSWTSDPGIGALYAKGDNPPAGKVKVLLHAAPGAKGMDISSESLWHGSTGGAGGEAEVVTGGRFNVQSVKTEGGVMNVYLAQQAFSAN